MNNIQIIYHKKTNQPIDYNVEPDLCPHCKHAIVPKFIDFILQEHRNHHSNFLNIAYQCPKSDCSKMFIAEYTYSLQEQYIFKGSQPIKLDDYIPEKSIKEISPEFVSIYNEAYKAEQIGLNKICGIAYRKSLEFLIKDYCSKITPEEKDAIEKETLSNTIRNRIEDHRIKDCATRATWLGNDEAHYVRKWVDKDLKNLKELIKLTELWIEANESYAKYLKEMSNNNEKR